MEESMKDSGQGGIIRTAITSQSGVYRYCLTRTWQSTTPPLNFIMLNPSTADAVNDDPTIRRCIGFARRELAGGIVVCNVYALRSRYPAALQDADDPYGPGNAKAIRTMIAQAARTDSPVVCAWGSHRIDADPWNHIAVEARARRVRLVCLGKTKHGHPRHPLYVRADQPFESFSMEVFAD